MSQLWWINKKITKEEEGIRKKLTFHRVDQLNPLIFSSSSSSTWLLILGDDDKNPRRDETSGDRTWGSPFRAQEKEEEEAESPRIHPEEGAELQIEFSES